MKKKANNTTTEKDNSSATLIRVRDNQRRSRARRKEYIQHLEQRLRTFESQGVVAAQEIQQAGRKVAKENALLRSLLVLRGVTADEIEAFLKSHAEFPPQAMPCSASAISRPVAPPVEPSVDPGVSQPAPLARSNTWLKREYLDDGNLSSFDPPVKVHADTNSLEWSTEQPSLTTIPADMSESEYTLHQFNGEHREKGNFTSCESAARIIASLRGIGDTHDLRSELGCGTEANCMVKNLSLFEMLDK